MRLDRHLVHAGLAPSRTAAARLGIRCLKRKSSTAANSSGESMICSRSPRVRSALMTVPLSSLGSFHLNRT